MPLAPMGCAVQLYQGSEKQTSWEANTIDGWYLQTSPQHYCCYVIHLKQTRSERVSDAVFFKTKYITQPTLTPADVITKALNDLTQALKGKSNQQGFDQIEALTKLNVILNNAPETDPEPNEPTLPTEPRQVYFDKTAKSLQIKEPIPTATVMRPLECTQPEPMHKVTINKIIPNSQTPRVEKIKSNPNNREQIRNCIASKTMAHLHAILTSDDPHEPWKEHRQSTMKRRTHTSSTDNSCNIQNTRKYGPNHLPTNLGD